MYELLRSYGRNFLLSNIRVTIRIDSNMESQSTVYQFNSQSSTPTAEGLENEVLGNVLTITINKLRNIRDFESTMHQAVILTNLMKFLKKKSREEIMKKQPSISRFNKIGKKNVAYINNEALHSPNVTTHNKISTSESELVDHFDTNLIMDTDFDNTSPPTVMVDFDYDFETCTKDTAKYLENYEELQEVSKVLEFDKEIVDEISAVLSSCDNNIEHCRDLIDENTSVDIKIGNKTVYVGGNDCSSSYKRSFDNIQYGTSQDFISRCNIEDTSDVDVVNQEPFPKRTKTEKSKQCSIDFYTIFQCIGY